MHKVCSTIKDGQLHNRIYLYNASQFSPHFHQQYSAESFDDESIHLITIAILESFTPKFLFDSGKMWSKKKCISQRKRHYYKTITIVLYLLE